MRERSTLEINLDALRPINPDLASRIDALSIQGCSEGFQYCGLAKSRTGGMVPLYQDGSATHSLFNPEREASQLIDSIGDTGFVLFAGFGGGYHIRDFLSRPGERGCVVAESGIESLLSVFCRIDLSDIVGYDRVTVVADCASDELASVIGMRYFPALYGNFRLVPLRSWQERNRKAFDALVSNAARAIEGIGADFSVQAHFGRLWHRNCILNLALASKIQGRFPKVNADSKALILAAGPSLESRLESIRAERDALVLFSTDTAWNTLADSGIIPDFFVSIDAQSVSTSHAMRPFDAKMTVILDVCGNPGIARKAHECGATVVFAAGMHPLARRASLFAPLPLLETGSGTVTIAALDVAYALGFREIETVGADFSYPGGKPYARGTYLAHSFGSTCTRMTSLETRYTDLMFRTPVGVRQSDGALTYTTDTLDRYASAFESFTGTRRWRKEDFAPYPFDGFIAEYAKELDSALHARHRDAMTLYSVLPLAAWASRHGSRLPKDEPGGFDGQKNIASVIQLALEMIAGYTSES